MPAIDSTADSPDIDPSVTCDACEAVCCRLTVVLLPGDEAVPERYVTEDSRGMSVMAHGEDGWCAALDLDTMRCSIYELRPGICRKFTMGSPFCRAEREAWPGLEAAMSPDGRGIPLLLR
ncbi:MAG: YkgJ family cysteine cluster protein [Pseudomonadota bacterium]|nr:YkgJ family cysteine cluster protein [Pseudomonadota bacterium]